MVNYNTELQSTELFEELSDADLMAVVGGTGQSEKLVDVNKATGGDVGGAVNAGQVLPPVGKFVGTVGQATGTLISDLGPILS